MDRLFMFHRVRQNTGHLHSPLTVGLICVLMFEEKIRKEMEEKETFVYPPSKRIHMNYGKTSRQKWIEFLEEQTSGKVQNRGEQQATHVQDTHPFEICDSDHGKKAGVA